jgi:hypothetical protein
MLHTFQEILVCSFAYIVLVAIAFQPKRNAATIETESQPIQYFPEVEETEEETSPEPTPIVIVERRPVAAFVAPSTPDVDYSTMSIRELKSECQKLTGTDRAVAKYSRLNRQQLIEALSR